MLPIHCQSAETYVQPFLVQNDSVTVWRALSSSISLSSCEHLTLIYCKIINFFVKLCDTRMSGYCVVEFFEEEGKPVEAVPAKWVFQRNKKCNWPCGLDRLKFTNLVSKCVDPLDQPKINWSIYNCRVLFGTGE